MKRVYTPETDAIIIRHEDKMFDKYSGIIRNYEDAFAQYNCILKVGQGWNNSLKNTSSENRLPFNNGYNSYIYCNVERNGEVIRYEDTDGEVDYYELSACWNISSISRIFFHLKVDLYEDTSDITEEINRLLETVSSL